MLEPLLSIHSRSLGFSLGLSSLNSTYVDESHLELCPAWMPSLDSSCPCDISHWTPDRLLKGKSRFLSLNILPSLLIPHPSSYEQMATLSFQMLKTKSLQSPLTPVPHDPHSIHQSLLLALPPVHIQNQTTLSLPPQSSPIIPRRMTAAVS